MAARLGNVIYWMASAVAVLLVGLIILVLLAPGERAVNWVIFYGVAAVVIWLIGRAARYILAAH